VTDGRPGHSPGAVALRWMAVGLVCPLLWVGLLTLTIGAHYRIEQDLCPSAALVSGICNDKGTQTLLWALKHAAMTLSLALVPWVGLLLAPAHQRGVAAGIVLAVQLAASLTLAGGRWSMITAAWVGAAAGAAIIVFGLCRPAPLSRT
jgi:hypothetical protein